MQARPVSPATAILGALGWFGSSPASAQVRYEGTPAATSEALSVPPRISLLPPDVEKLRREDQEPKAGPLRYGVVLSTGISVTEIGSLDTTASGLLVARVEIYAPGAKSLGLEFSKYNLPVGGKLFLYDQGMDHVLGSYIHENRIPTGEFVIEPFPGDSVIVEYSQPASLRSMAEIVVSGVIYDYRDVFELEDQLDSDEGSGPDGSCTFIDVNCPEGAPFPLQKRATVRTLYFGGLCSGSLINNTAFDGTRYVYTANHCGQGTTTVFRFNFQTPGCGTGSAPTSQNVSGAAVLATDSDTDGRLLRITNTIPSSYSPYYAGWSLSSSNLAFGMSMHHPGGSPKKISIDSDGGGPSLATIVGLGPIKSWGMSFDIGATAGGSSGGPLFDENNRLRGALTGGDEDCLQDFYGRFHTFWSETTISQYLDPLGTGMLVLDGHDPFGSPPVLPTLAGISPSDVPAFLPPDVTLTGSGFAGAGTVQVGSTVLTSPVGFTIVSDSTITIKPPQASTVGPVNVIVVNGAGPSNPLALNYVETSPPQLIDMAFTAGGQPFTWTFAGPASDTWFLILALNDGSTFPFGPYSILLNSLVFTQGVLSPAGLGSTGATVPTGLAGAVFYSQIVTWDGASDIQASNITQSSIVF